MTRHRCTRCKEDVGEFGIRHKHAQGLFCEPCLRELRYKGGTVTRGGFFGFIGSFWDSIKVFIGRTFQHRTVVKLEEQVIKTAFHTMKARAREIPRDARTLNPQKR